MTVKTRTSIAHRAFTRRCPLFRGQAAADEGNQLVKPLSRQSARLSFGASAGNEAESPKAGKHQRIGRWFRHGGNVVNLRDVAVEGVLVA